jgi:DNA-binding FadR family transcriptional regulator
MSRDLAELRRIVEPAAVRLAAIRASDNDRKALRAAYMAMERAVAGKGDYVKADLDFHATILGACGNQYVRQMQEAMSAILQASFEIISEKPGGPAFSLPMHEAVCKAIEKGDPVAAERAALVLIEQAEADLRDRLEARKAGSRGLAKPSARTAHSRTR